MRFREEHRAVCSKCSYVERARETGCFINSFALPRLCPNCGERMHARNQYWQDAMPHWRHHVVKQEFQKQPATWNPLTWLSVGRWVDVDVHDMAAR